MANYLDEAGLQELWDLIKAEYGKYGLHWWKRRTSATAPQQTLGASREQGMNYHGETYAYASSITCNADKTISLNSPTTKKLSYSTKSQASVLVGKYYAINNSNNKYSTVWKCSGGPKDYGSDGYKMTVQDVTVKNVTTVGEWAGVQSELRNAYPDSGVSGGYEYEYLGIPYNNAVFAGEVAGALDTFLGVDE